MSSSLSLAIPTLLSEIKSCVAIQVLAKGDRNQHEGEGEVSEEAERRSEAAMEKSRRLLVELHKVEGDIAAKSIQCIGNAINGQDTSGTSLLPQYTDVHIEWLAAESSNNYNNSSNPVGSRQTPSQAIVAEIVLRDASVVQSGLVREWMVAALKDTPPSSSTSHLQNNVTAPPPSQSITPLRKVVIGNGDEVVVAVDQAPLNHYHCTILGGGGGEEGIKGSSHITGGAKLLGPSYGMGFLEGVQRVAPNPQPATPQKDSSTIPAVDTNTSGTPTPPLPSSSSADEGSIRVHADLLPDGVTLWRGLRATMLNAGLEVDVCEAATKYAVDMAVKGLGEKTNGSRGYWVSTSFDRAYGAGLDATPTSSTTPQYQAAGQKRPRPTPQAQQALTRTSKLGLVAVYYLIAAAPGGEEDSCVVVGSNIYKLVPGYRKETTATTSPTTSVPTQAAPQQQASANLPAQQQQQQPLSLAALLPTAVVAPTREMDFVSVLLAFRPKF